MVFLIVRKGTKKNRKGARGEKDGRGDGVGGDGNEVILHFNKNVGKTQ